MATIQLFASRRLTPTTRHERTPRRRPPAWLWLPALAVGVVVLLPLVYLVARASEGGEAAWLVIARPKTIEVVLNTVALVAAVAVSTVVIAVPLAWLTTRTDLPGRRFWATVSALPLVIPSVRRRPCPCRRAGAAGDAARVAGAVRSRAAALDLWFLGQLAGADPLHLPLRLPLGAGRLSRPRSRPGRSRPRPRPQCAAGVLPHHVAATTAGDRGGSAAGGALRAR